MHVHIYLLSAIHCTLGPLHLQVNCLLSSQLNTFASAAPTFAALIEVPLPVDMPYPKVLALHISFHLLYHLFDSDLPRYTVGKAASMLASFQ